MPDLNIPDMNTGQNVLRCPPKTGTRPVDLLQPLRVTSALVFRPHHAPIDYFFFCFEKELERE